MPNNISNISTCGTTAVPNLYSCKQLSDPGADATVGVRRGVSDITHLFVFFRSLFLSISTIILIIFGADDGAPGVGKEKTKKQKSS